MKLFRTLQALWVVGWTGYVAAIFIWGNYTSIVAIIYEIVVGIYVIACVGTFWNKRWAWVLSVLILCVLWLRYAAKLVLNVKEAVFGSLYQDSPVTMFVLAVELIPTLGFSSLLLILLWGCRKDLLEKLKPRGNSGTE